ncbi:MAG TPA: PaaI family thioesterase, partial [Thermoleophilia bacterium]|nr:PaaI family thioesterase [Thermoleophilia bacterium]
VGRITRNTSRLFEGTGEILLSDGSVAVEARGKYLRQPIHEIVDVDFETQWFADERARPDEVDV